MSPKIQLHDDLDEEFEALPRLQQTQRTRPYSTLRQAQEARGRRGKGGNIKLLGGDRLRRGSRPMNW